MAYEIAIHHHERWDGKGYPNKLEGEQIPLSARIVSVADVYDALRSKRVYKPAFDHEKSMTIIKEGRGTQFDPDVVDAFIRVESQVRSISEKHLEASMPADPIHPSSVSLPDQAVKT